MKLNNLIMITRSIVLGFLLIIGTNIQAQIITLNGIIFRDSTAQKIDSNVAKQLHRYYLLNVNTPDDYTRGIVFDFGEFKQIVDSLSTRHENLNSTNLMFVAYYGRYDGSFPDSLKNKNTLIIHFAEQDTAGIKLLKDEIWNFGNARPPYPVMDEIIKPMD